MMFDIVLAIFAWGIMIVGLIWLLGSISMMLDDKPPKPIAQKKYGQGKVRV